MIFERFLRQIKLQLGMRYRLEIKSFLPLSKTYSCSAKGYTGSLAALKGRPYICGPLDRTFSNDDHMSFIVDHLVNQRRKFAA